MPDYIILTPEEMDYEEWPEMSFLDHICEYEPVEEEPELYEITQ